MHADPLRNGPGLTLERLIPYHQSHLLQGSIHNIAPGGSGGGLVAHEGEEVAYILEGQVEFMVGDERFLLKWATRSATDQSSRTDIGTAATAMPS